MSFDDPIRLLREEHDATLEVVDRMELAAAELRGPHMAEPLAILRSGLEFLEREIRAHSDVEEQVLYMALKPHVPGRTEENNVLFVMAAQMLPDQEYQDLARAMDALRHTWKQRT